MNIDSQSLPDNSNLRIQPLFSVVITTFNRANLLIKALDSLICQTENDWEAIIVDDESTDDTYLKIVPYLKSNSNIKYIRRNHGGEALSKNTGIAASSGKYISFLDSDDEYDPVHLQSRKEILIQDPSIRFLYGGTKIIGNQYVPDRFDPRKRIHLSKCAIGGTFFIERDTLIKLRGFRKIILGTDSDLFDRVLEAGIPTKETNLQTYIYHRENEDSITNMLIKSRSELDESYIKTSRKKDRSFFRL
jgi:glycosyltransferase involved in cell wall biosynthesis